MAPGYPRPIWRMAMRAESFAELEPVCVFALHGTGMLCRTILAQLHLGVLSASRSHAERPYQQACKMRNDFHEDTIGTTAVEIPFYHRIAFSQSYDALSGHIVIKKDIVF